MKPALLIIAMLAATLPRCSGPEQVAGGSTSTDNARVLGTVVTQGGLPAPGIPVHLLPSDYNPAEPSAGVVRADTTDRDGRFLFDKVAENLYSLEAIDAAAGSRLLIRDVVVFSTTDSITRPPDTLKPAAAVLLPLDSSARLGGYFYAAGSSSFVMIDSAGLNAGAVTLGGVAADAAIDISYIDAGAQGSPRIVGSQMRVSAADTAVVSLLPAPWRDVSIGETVARGGAALIHDTMVIAGGGPDIWVWADGFHFSCQPLIGDGSIQARALYLENTGPWAKAAVMIRESLTPESPHVTLSLESSMNGIDPVPGISLHDRKVTGGASGVAGSVDSIGAPCWIRLTRTGALFQGFWSLDGTTWQPVGVDSVNIGDTVLAGIAVTSHDARNLATARFDGVTITP